MGRGKSGGAGVNGAKRTSVHRASRCKRSGAGAKERCGSKKERCGSKRSGAGANGAVQMQRSGAGANGAVRCMCPWGKLVQMERGECTWSGACVAQVQSVCSSGAERV